MRCPFCGHDDTQVKDSRPADDNAAIRRRRQCPGCGARFTTFERVQLREFVVIKSDGGREPFDRAKLVRSMRLPLRKRPVSEEQLERTVNDILNELDTMGELDIISRQIGELVMRGLYTSIMWRMCAMPPSIEISAIQPISGNSWRRCKTPPARG